MSDILIRQRWAPWWFALPVAIGAAGLGYVFFSALFAADPLERMGSRILIPPFVLSIYWFAALLLNSRYLSVSLAGIRVYYRPIPLAGRSMRREDMAGCVVGRLAAYDEAGLLPPDYTFVAGVQSQQGAYIQIFGPFDKKKLAAEAAGRVFHALGGNLPIIERDAYHDDASSTTRIFLWLGAYALALCAGFCWEFWS